MCSQKGSKEMIKIVLALGVLMLPVCAFADIQCPPPGEDGSFEKTVAMIKVAKSCYDADQIAKQCGWGSSADVQIAGAAGDICANTFRGKLTPADKTIYLTSLKNADLSTLIFRAPSISVHEPFARSP
jgi:hypothetical protein